MEFENHFYLSRMGKLKMVLSLKDKENELEIFYQLEEDCTDEDMIFIFQAFVLYLFNQYKSVHKVYMRLDTIGLKKIFVASFFHPVKGDRTLYYRNNPFYDE